MVSDQSKAGSGRKRKSDVTSKKKPKKSAATEPEDEFEKFLKQDDPELLNELQNDKKNVDDGETEEFEEQPSEFVADENYLEKKKRKEKKPKTETSEKGEDEVQQLKSKKSLHSLQLEKCKAEFEIDGGTLFTCLDLMRVFTDAIKTKAKKSENAKQKGRDKGATDVKVSFGPSEIVSKSISLASAFLKTALSKALNTKKADKDKVKYNTLSGWDRIDTIMEKFFYSCTGIIRSPESVSPTNLYDVVKTLVLLHKFLECYPNIQTRLGMCVCDLWSETENDSVELSSFLLLEKIANSDMTTNHPEVVKNCLSVYMKQCSKATADTHAKIAFMQQCIVQLMVNDINHAYRLMFNSLKEIVQLIKAVTNTIEKEKAAEKIAELCSWKTVHSLHLWVSLFGAVEELGILSTLVRPIVETVNELINYAKAAKDYPLRFHGIEMLIMLARSTKKFIPIFQFILDVFSSVDFNKKVHSKVPMASVTPLDFSVALRLETSDVNSVAFVKAVAARMQKNIVELMELHACDIASPELFLIPIVHLRKFLKLCVHVDHHSNFKEIVTVMEQNAAFVAQEREKVGFTIAETDKIEIWEKKLRAEGRAPALKFYTKYKAQLEAAKKKAAHVKAIPDGAVEGGKKTKQFVNKSGKKGSNMGVKKSGSGVEKKKKHFKLTSEVKKPKKKKRYVGSNKK